MLNAGKCRVGCEAGDKFHHRYGCLDGFCPLAMPFHTLCEIARCGGNYTHLSGQNADPYKYTFNYPEAVVQFQLNARQIK